MASISIAAAAALLLVCYSLASALYRWVENIRASWRSGFPTIITPFHPLNIFFMLTQGIYRSIIPFLPFGLSEVKYFHFFYQDWPFTTKFELFETYGDVITLASTGGRVMYVGNAEVASQLGNRRQDFPKDISFYESVKLYGDSVLTTEGEAWRHHRKVTAPPFSESVHSLVWEEAISQTCSMIKTWTSTTRPLDTIRDSEVLMRNVISKAGFGVSMSFLSSNVPSSSTGKETLESSTVAANTAGSDLSSCYSSDDDYFSESHIPKGYSMSYGESFDWLLDNVLPLLIVPKFLMRWGPRSLQKTEKSYNDVGKYIKELIRRERDSSVASSSIQQPATRGKQNLLSALVRGSDSEESKKQLSEDDVIGNIFVFAVAGLETSAGTLRYALLCLALHQSEQDWLHNDTKHSLEGESEDPREWDYTTVFPKLVACMCVINETLRLYPTFQALVKRNMSDQLMNYKGKQHNIPKDTSFFICLIALHYNPAYWGDDASNFAPQNWDSRQPQSGWFQTQKNGSRKTIIQETQTGPAPFCHLRQPIKGAYLPFSDGFRSCLGRNFALVELCAILAVIFRSYRVVIARKGADESQEMADRRARETILNGTRQRLTLSLREEVGIKLIRRD